MNNYKMEDMLPLLAERIQKYTSNESTSVSNSKAKQILGSILYCMNLTDDSCADEQDHILITNKESVRDIYYLGRDAKKEKMKRAEELFNTIAKEFPPINNEYYRTTLIDGMPEFFKWYDLDYDAQNTILTLDYPLINSVDKLSGIDLICEYLVRFQTEQAYLKCFDTALVNEMLSGFNSTYSDLVINICALVLRCTLVCEITREDILQLYIPEDAQAQFIKRVRLLSEDDLYQLLVNSFNNILNTLDISSHEKVHKYLIGELSLFTRELLLYKDAMALDNIIPTRKKKLPINLEYFKDGIAMKDEELRALINRMQDCSNLSDKIDMVKEQITSLKDLKEILEECFWDEEYDAVFALLTHDEITHLLNEIEEKQEFRDDLSDWESKLKIYPIHK